MFRGFHGVARIGIGVGAATDHEEGDDAGLALFDGGLCEAGVVAADGVVVGAQSCVVTGAFEQHSFQLTLFILHPQDWNAAIGGASGVDAEDHAGRSEFAAIHDQIGDAGSPG